MSDDRRADARLADRIRSGDTDALGELYDRHSAAALATAMRVVGDRDEAEDEFWLIDADGNAMAAGILTDTDGVALSRSSGASRTPRCSP